jgi:hypothetical protein
MSGNRSLEEVMYVQNLYLYFSGLARQNNLKTISSHTESTDLISKAKK